MADFYSGSRSNAKEQARELLWNSIQNSDWWEHPFTKLTEAEVSKHKIELQHRYWHPTFIAFKQSFMPTVLEASDERINTLLRYGASRRLISIYHSACTFAEIVYPGRTDVADEQEHQRLGDALQIIYLGIPAFFDALSVAVFYSRSPARHHDKNSDLFSKRFLEAAGLLKLYGEINQYYEWQWRIKVQLRHRFAHRIPPYVPSSELSPNDQTEYERLQIEYSSALRRKDFDQSNDILSKQKRLGKFAPWLYFFEENSYMPLDSTVLNDLLTFQVVSLSILEHLLPLPGFSIVDQ